MARRVLLTGANGYIAAHILSQLLEQGHSVRAVVRSQAKADQVRADNASAGDSLDFALVPDITSRGAFDKAVQSDPPFDAVIHTASPLQFANVKSTLNDMLIPAKRGTEEILRSIQGFAPSVLRVVFTSSFAAIVDHEIGNIGKVFSEEDWSPLTWDGAANSDNVGLAYLASKKYAEIAGSHLLVPSPQEFKALTHPRRLGLYGL